MQGRTPTRKIGFLGGAFFLLWAGIVVITTTRSCSGPYQQAKRALGRDPCQAARLFAEDVRDDWKGSVRSLVALRDLPDPCALKELINLMDLPDGRNGEGNRKNLAEFLNARVAGIEPKPPTYHPEAPQPFRDREKTAWLKWYDEVYLKK